MSSEALTVLNNQDLIPAGAGLEGFVLKPANMILVQRSTTLEGAAPHLGKLLDTTSMNSFDELQAVPLAINMGRVLFPPDGTLGAEPICRSNDGVKPSDNAATPQSPDCASCDHGPKVWKDFRKTGVKPDCSEKYRILFVTREHGLPFWLTANQASITNVKKLKDAIYRDVLVNRAKGINLSLFDYTFAIKPASVQGKKGSYYVLTFQNVKRVTTVGEFGPLYKEFVLRQQALRAVDETDSVIEGELVESGSSQYESV